MPNPEDFIKNLLVHAEQPYNSQQAHEYYLRTRELKGRQPAEQKSIPSRRVSTRPSVAVKTVKKVGKSGKVGKAPVLISVKRQQAVDGRVAGLQTRLAALETRLKELLDNAKKKEEGPEKKSDLTAKQKQAAEKSSEKYAKENKAEIAKKAKEKREKDPLANLSIEEIRAKIVKIKAEIKIAIQKAREKSSNSKTVKGR